MTEETETTIGGTARAKMPHTQAVREQLSGIPPEKRSSKSIRTLVGISIVALGWFAKVHWPDLPSLLAFGTVAFGGVTASGETLSYPFRLFVAMLRDLLSVVRGNGP